MSRGSGLFVPMEGVVANHHFLLPADGSDFQLLAGDYVLRVFAKRVSVSAAEELASIRVRISESHARDLLDDNTGIYFDWGPDQQAYHPLIEKREPRALPAALLELAGQ